MLEEIIVFIFTQVFFSLQINISLQPVVNFINNFKSIIFCSFSEV